MGKRLLFVCPDNSIPSGGIKQIYRQVDVLNENDFSAYILHKNEGFRCQWFNNSTPILYHKELFQNIAKLKTSNSKTIKTKLKLFVKQILSTLKPSSDIKLTKDDILVFPEIYGPHIATLYDGIKKVIYNQGVYQTFFGYNLNLNSKDTPYTSKDLIAVIVNSEDARQYMSLAFPNVNLYRIHYGFNNKEFFISENKKRQICFMTRRLRSDIIQVINILKFRGILEGWKILPIENMNEQQVAQCMKQSAIFLSFNINEGFGMPPAEAMACGCIVVGYTGQGGNEIFNSEFSYPIPDRNVQEYVKTLEKVIKAFNVNPELFVEKGKKASEFILTNYSMTVEEQDIISTWKAICN